MTSSRPADATTGARRAPRADLAAVRIPALPLACVAALAGPWLLVIWLHTLAADGRWLTADMHTAVALSAVLALFAPHPVSLPSLWSQTLRDELGRGQPPLRRAVALLTGLPAHPAGRWLTVFQTVGLAAGLAAAAGWLPAPALGS